MNLRLRLIIEWLVIALLSSLAVVLALQWRGTSAFDYLFYDQLSGLSRPEADPDILLVTIDDPSLQALGKWPWPRQNHAALLTKLQAAKPKAILLDILLSEPSIDADDAALAAAMQQRAPVYIPMHFVSPGSDGQDYDVVQPIPSIAKAAAGIGQVNVEFDNDGVVRRAILCFPDGEMGLRWPHLAELVARVDGKPSLAYRSGDRCGSSVLIPYATRGSFTEISYADLLSGDVPAELIKGHIVIIGATAVGLGDSYPVPLADGGLLSGAEIMANMVSAIKRNNFVTPLPFTATLLLSLLPVWILLVGFLRWSPRSALIASLSVVAIVLIGSASLLGAQIWFPPGAAILGLFLVYPLWGWRRLQAMSDFMDAELGALEKEGEIVPVSPPTQLAADMVGRQSATLAGAIDHMRDLRRVIADTLEHLPDPMFVTDLDDTITLTNQQLDDRIEKDITGQSLAAALDDFVLPSYRRAVDAYLGKRADRGAADEDGFVRFISMSARTFVMRAAKILSDTSELRGYIHYLADITDLARAETDREEALQLLSHDMRAPQSAIIAMLPDLRDKNARARIERHARRTMQLAQDFVQIARMGETEFEGIELLLAELARDVADSLWPLAKERNITIDVVDDEGDAFVFAEADSLLRALTNLVDNAIKHSPDGGVITINVARIGGGLLELSVQDQGEGIDADLLPQLFTRFASGREGTSRVKSLGLGLAFVRAVAERHQGTASAENMASGGASFTLTLPESLEEVPTADV
jgi:CHASE2 domain-containing sensor protein/signal transduction histidine kinase